MANLVVSLREEIRRLARKEIRLQTGSMKQAVSQYRREIARLKRQLRSMEKRLAMVAAARPTAAIATVENHSLEGTRFSVRSLKSQRRRLGFSASHYAMLVGVSPLTIYNWEHGKSRPRKSQLAVLASIRGIGKREAKAKLGKLAPTPPHRQSRSKKSHAR